jgi:O-antigen/teichoic acid export membrane protein
MSPINPSPQRLFRSTLWSLAGTVVPMLVALAAVPWLLHRLGQERLGVLSLIWVVVGYFSFLDMGLGRAITVRLASMRAQKDHLQDLECGLLGSALALLLGFGILAMGVCSLLLACGVLPLKLAVPGLTEEVIGALWWTLPSVPLLLVASALRGQMEGLVAFRVLNLIRIPTGTLLVALPCLVAEFSPDLRFASASMLLVRVVSVTWTWRWLARHGRMGFFEFMGRCADSAHRRYLRDLLTLGGWVTISNVVGPLIVYMDRFLIGATLGATAVVGYVVPFDVVSRLPILVAALASVLLPEISRLSSLAVAQPDSDQWRRAGDLVRRASAVSAASVVVVVALGVLLIPSALSMWLGADFARGSSRVAQILLLAFGINALAQIPFVALQAVGSARVVAILHLTELLPYAFLVVWMVRQWGLEGAAWAWLVRSTLDYVLLAGLWHRVTGQPARAFGG